MIVLKSTCAILSNFKYIGISNDTRSAPYTLVTSDLRRPSWHEKKSLFENRRHDTLVGLPTKFHSILESLVTFFFNGRYSLLCFGGPQLYNSEALPFTYGQHVVIELADKLYNSVTVCFL